MNHDDQYRAAVGALEEAQRRPGATPHSDSEARAAATQEVELATARVDEEEIQRMTADTITPSDTLSLKLIAGRLGIATNALLVFAREQGIVAAARAEGGMPFYDVASVSAAVETNRGWFFERAARVEREQAEHRAAADRKAVKSATPAPKPSPAKPTPKPAAAERRIRGPEVIVLRRRAKGGQ